MIRITSLFFILVFFSCAPTRISKERPSYSISPQKIYYVVKKGDSLWGISKQYGVGVKELMDINNISSPYDLRVGQKIIIPYYRQIVNTLFFWPLEGEIINFFGEDVDNTINRGLNIKVALSNRQVKASAEGKVVFANYLKGWGETIILKHDSNFYTIYANLEKAEVKEGVSVKKQQVIGKVAAGKNGNHILHFEIRRRHIPEDPLKYLN